MSKSAPQPILIVEHNESMARLINLTLTFEGMSAVTAGDLPKALDLSAEHPLAAGIVGSRSLSSDEIAELKRVSRLPLLVLSGGGPKQTTQLCASTGADDFLDLPFGPDELISRVRFLLGEPEAARRPGTVRVGGLEIDLRRRAVTRAGVRVPLSDTDWRLLERLATSPDGVALTEETLVKTWGPAYVGEAPFLEMWISRLNQKLNPGGAEAPTILPFHGVGYRLATQPKRV
jgi:two-component system KDP operon response regulator KdpE